MSDSTQNFAAPKTRSSHDELVDMLSTMSALVRLRYGNLEEDVNSLLEKSEVMVTREMALREARDAEVPNAAIQDIFVDLMATQDGWAGEGSKAPDSTTCLEVLQALEQIGIDEGSIPDVETDEDGVVTLTWARGADERRFAMVFRGDGMISIVATRTIDRDGFSLSVPAGDSKALAAALWRASAFETAASALAADAETSAPRR